MATSWDYSDNLFFKLYSIEFKSKHIFVRHFHDLSSCLQKLHERSAHTLFQEHQFSWLSMHCKSRKHKCLVFALPTPTFLIDSLPKPRHFDTSQEQWEFLARSESVHSWKTLFLFPKFFCLLLRNTRRRYLFRDTTELSTCHNLTKKKEEENSEFSKLAN